MFRRPSVRAGIVLSVLIFALTACAGGGGGDVHALGEEVLVGYNEPTSAGGRGASTTVGITVLDVRQGSQQDLTQHGFEADEESRNTVPYYVDVRYENEGENAITRNLDVSLEDSEGNLIGSTLIFNFGDQSFPPCEAVTEGKLQPGESYESCTLVLVPEGIEVGAVSFLSDNGPDEEPEFVYWATE